MPKHDLVHRYLKKKAGEFTPNSPASADSGVFNLPFSREDSKILLMSVPWEATTSYGGGTSKGPKAIFNASKQLDLGSRELKNPWQAGIYMEPENKEILTINNKAKKLAQGIIKSGLPDLATQEKVNLLSQNINDQVQTFTSGVLREGKLPGIIGGDHSVPLGAWKAVSIENKRFGLLHFDAHLDMRDSFEGFKYSHASILRNGLDEVPNISKVVQIGIRDYCDEELEYLKGQGERVRTYFDRDLADRKARGENWDNICREMLSHLPERVWITFDIDGLDPYLCPNTGTPVPGGLNFLEAEYLIREVALSGRKIVGFDLNEVAPHPTGENEWDANVAMRILYKLCSWTLYSQGLIERL